MEDNNWSYVVRAKQLYSLQKSFNVSVNKKGKVFSQLASENNSGA